MRRALVTLAAVGLLGGAFALGFLFSGRSGRTAAPTRQVSVVAAVRDALASRYYRPVPPEVLKLATVHAMLAALGDPYTEYLDPPEYELLQRETAGTYSGIGVSLLPTTAGLLVVNVQPGPGRRAGIRLGDVIVRIGGTSTSKLGIAGALTSIAGPSGSRVRLDVRRGDELEHVTVARASVEAPAVSSRLVSFGGRTYGYIGLSSFRNGVAGEIGTAVRRLLRDRATGIVLDLRGNPGGLLEQAVAVSSLFIRHGVVVTLQGFHQPRQVFRVTGRAVAPRIPLVVLVDRYTASSGEIVAAALRDNHRATLIGERTYGKAVVQSIDPILGGGALAITTARYLTPSGTDISDVGLAPNVKVGDDPRTAMDDVLTVGLSALAAAQS
jgi:carboxyl-terminal processing protease